MMNINEYFQNLYMNANTDELFEKVMEEEIEVYEMENLETWAKEHNVDLTVTDEHGITELQRWAWNFED